MQRARTGGGSNLSRRDFLRLGGAGLAGAALLGAAGGGGGGNNIVFSSGPMIPGSCRP